MTTRVALITGCGKRDGMGRAIALNLAASGIAVVVTDKQATGVLNRRQLVVGVTDESWGGVGSLVEEITAAGGTATAQLGDISDAADAQRMVDSAGRTGVAGSTSSSMAPAPPRALTARTSKTFRSRSSTS